MRSCDGQNPIIGQVSLIPVSQSIPLFNADVQGGGQNVDDAQARPRRCLLADEIIGGTLHIDITDQPIVVQILKATSYGPEKEDERAYKGNKAKGQMTPPGTIEMRNMMGHWFMLISTGSEETAACIKIDEIGYDGKRMKFGKFFREVLNMDKDLAETITGLNVLKRTSPIKFKK